MTKRDSTPIRRATTSTPKATADRPPSDEAPWQHLMLVNYLVFEALDAMQQERASSSSRSPTPLNDHWQGFIHHLRVQKPKLGACLDTLGQEDFLKHGRPQ